MAPRVDLKRVGREIDGLAKFIAAETAKKLERDKARRVADVQVFKRFCRMLPIRTKTGGFINFEPKHWHYEQLQFEDNRCGRDVVIKARQIGMSTLELARDVQYSRLHAGVQVLVVVHDTELASQLFLDARRFADALVECGAAGSLLYSNKREIVWSDNGSAVRVIEAGATEEVADKKGRSGTIHRLHATEQAFWGAAQNTMRALLSAVPDNGEVVIESTANGVGGDFHDRVKRAGTGELEGYKLHFWPWYVHEEYRRDPGESFDDTPRDDWEIALRNAACDDEQIAWWRWKISELGGGEVGLEAALQEFPITEESAFRTTGKQYLSAGACDVAERNKRVPIAKQRIEHDGRLLGELWIYERPQVGHEYYVPADIADGGGCWSTCGAIHKRAGKVCAVFGSLTIDSGDLGIVGARIAKLYNNALFAPERNTGQATIRAARVEEKYSRIYEHSDGKYGWLTSPSSRPVMWDDLRRAIEDGEATTPDLRMLGELRGLTRDKTGKPVHGPGSTDDFFTMWAIGWQLRLIGAGAKVGSTRTGTGSETSRLLGSTPRARDLG